MQYAGVHNIGQLESDSKITGLTYGVCGARPDVRDSRLKAETRAQRQAATVPL